jgi:dTDP-4-dehydrorhamnose 3,5-epimerase
MIFHEQGIEGVYIIESEPFKDERGVFRRNYCLREFQDHIGFSGSPIMQANISENKYKYTLRGFHYQTSPNREAKTLTVIKGSICDIVLDLRPESETYLQWRTWCANADGRSSIHVPMGCANAFLTLEDETIVHYYSSEFYTPEKEKGIRWNDPTIFKTPNGEYVSPWPIEMGDKPAYISDKDNNWPNFGKT